MRLSLSFLKAKPARFLLLMGLAAVFPGHAQAWWKSDWTLRKKITIDASDAGGKLAGAVSATPVLIRLHDGNFQFAAAKEDGSDIRFIAADDKTPLKFHLEKYDSLLSEAYVWVQVPEIKAGTQTSVWLYYGNGGPAAERADDSKGTYDADTVLVYHFGEKGAPAADSSAAGNNAGNPGTAVEGSLIAGGLRFDGKSTVTIPAKPSLEWNAGAAFTWSAWIKPAAVDAEQVIFSRSESGNGLAIGLNAGVPFVEATAGGTPQRAAGVDAVAAGTWHHLAVTGAGSTLTLYVDGKNAGTVNAGVPALKGALTLGSDAAGGKAGFVGELDELELAKVARTADFIKLAAISQGGGEQSAKLVALGDDEAPSGWFGWLNAGHFGVIIQSLTLDGWIVIGILAVMAVTSWLVMVSKASYLSGIARGNDLFMKEWRHVAADLSVLDEEPDAKTLGGRIDEDGQRAMRNASVYRIYHIGVEEIRHRLGVDSKGKTLSARSIQAIRASLDGGLVREMQALNKLMVLLTIAISGGPFLGLLGTVVGVMITFAAIAAAGDVNVNAIAPGIAAALVATVAGLAVAIPALFGYNYLLSKIKNATADMQVFIDEFVTKMAEFYGGRSE